MPTPAKVAAARALLEQSRQLTDNALQLLSEPEPAPAPGDSYSDNY